MKILITTETLHPGGAEAFVLRLAHALQCKGHQVIIFSFYENYYNKNFHLTNGPGTQVEQAKIPLKLFFQKADSLFLKLRIDIKLTNFFIKRALSKIMNKQGTEVIHSHLFNTDWLSLSVAYKLAIPVITTIHGDYSQFFERSASGNLPIVNFRSKLKDTLNKLTKIVCISDEQLHFFQENFPTETQNKLIKIYNGYQATSKIEGKGLRAKLGISTHHFVFGMVARGIPSKGWQVAIDALLMMNDPGCHLILVGDSEYLQTLALKYVDKTQVHFVGHSNKPLDWISIFDVGVLPTIIENLPTVVMEYLYCGKPAITSDAGELRNMLVNTQYPAGIIVSIVNEILPPEHFSKAMKRYREDKELYDLHQKNTAACFSPFDMDECVKYYEAVYSANKN